MFDVDEAIEALTIFKKYKAAEYGPGYNVGIDAAEHDEIWGGPKPELVSAEDTIRLLELGWTPDEWGTRFHTYV